MFRLYRETQRVFRILLNVYDRAFVKIDFLSQLVIFKPSNSAFNKIQQGSGHE